MVMVLKHQGWHSTPSKQKLTLTTQVITQVIP